MVQIRLIPLGYVFTPAFNQVFVRLCLSASKTATFYAELDRVRQQIRRSGIEAVIVAIETGNVLSPSASMALSRLRDELPYVGLEIQARVVVALLGLKD